MTVSLNNVDRWQRSYDNEMIDHHSVVRHIAWAKKEDPSRSWEDIGKPLGITKSRVQEIMTNPDTRLGYAYRMRVTDNVLKMFPGGVPMLRGYTVQTLSTEENLDLAFGPRSQPALQQLTLPLPPPVVAPEVGIAIHNLVGDMDFDPEGEHTEEQYRAYLGRLEVRITQLEGQLADYQKGTGPLRNQLEEFRAQARDFSNMNARQYKVIEGLNATVASLTKELLEAQITIDQQTAILKTIKEAIKEDE